MILSIPSASGSPGRNRVCLARVQRDPEAPQLKRFLMRLAPPSLARSDSPRLASYAIGSGSVTIRPANGANSRPRTVRKPQYFGCRNPDHLMKSA